MNFKKYHESKNLFDITTIEKGRIDNGDVGYASQTTSLTIIGGTVYFTTNATYRGVCSGFFEIPETGNLTFNFTRNLPLGVKFVFYDSNKTWLNADVTPQLIDIPPATASIPTGAKYVRLSFTGQITGGSDYVMSNIMLNTGSTPLPYEPYSSEVWHDIPYYIHKTATDALTLPAVIYPNDTLITVGIKGQSSQASTPTPSQPCDVLGCGERTGNLCYLYKTGYRLDNVGNEVEAEDFNIYAVSASANTTYTLNCAYSSAGTTTLRIIAYNSGSFSYKIAEVNLNSVPYTFTTPSACDEVKISLSKLSTNIMLNTGSTALPYEPYGIKIPISSASTTTPVYLGEVQSTRRIKKYEFTGQENISQGSENFYTSLPTPGVPYSNMYCTHNVDGACSVNNNGGYIWFKISSWSDYTTAGDLKAFFQQEYAAGTPVTVWYVLATEETAVVNEPLMKIGDYADTVSNVSIPVTAGGDTLSVGTTVQPSEVTVNYKGWHPVADVHERENGAWT